MKKIIIYFVLILININSFGQISTTKVAKAKEKKVALYDSTENFLGYNYKQYIGQELYLMPKAEPLREYGYEGFIKDINKNDLNRANIFNCCDGNNSKYEKMQSQYFDVLEIIKDTKSNYSKNIYLKLKMKENNKIVFYKYSPEFSIIFPFLVVGYYDKQKEIFVGKEILIRPFPIIEGANQKKTLDINTGEEIEFQKGEYVKCIDITIDEKYYELSLLLENQRGQKFLFSRHSRDLNIQRILTKDEAESYRNKFGEKNWNTILEEKIKIGFTEEMVKVSWGDPEKINKSSYGDQWIYDQQYLYFENGVLKSYN